jgi:hypothetical protein
LAKFNYPIPPWLAWKSLEVVKMLDVRPYTWPGLFIMWGDRLNLKCYVDYKHGVVREGLHFKEPGSFALMKSKWCQ